MLHLPGSRHLVARLLTVGAIALGAVAGHLAARRSDRETIVPASTTAFRRQELVVLVASSKCRFSTDESLRRAYWTIVGEERERAGDSVLVSAVGVSVDRDAERALKTLREAGRFDEYAAGNGWLGQAAIAYVLRDLTGPPVVPEVLIVERAIQAVEPPLVGADSLYIRLAGRDAIVRWAGRMGSRRGHDAAEASPGTGGANRD